MAHSIAPRRVADTTTGEVHLVEKDKRSPYRFPTKPEERKRHVVTGALAAKELSLSDYRAATFRVLWHLIYTTDETCLIDQTQSEIAQSTGLAQGSVSRALKQLTEGGHVTRKGRRMYLNPLTSFTGSGAEHQRAVAKLVGDQQPDAEVVHLRPVG